MAAKAQWRSVADQLSPTVPKLVVLMDSAEEDVLAYMTFPAQHRTKLHPRMKWTRPFRAKLCYSPCARATPWRRTELRLQGPSGRLFTALPVWSVRAPFLLDGSPTGRRTVHRPALRDGRFHFLIAQSFEVIGVAGPGLFPFACGLPALNSMVLRLFAMRAGLAQR